MSKSGRGGLEVELWTNNGLPSASAGSNLLLGASSIVQVTKVIVAYSYMQSAGH